ncbi:type II secretion system F family protein [Clostridium felsineum]|uniref:Type II secretion system protein GspF domain-containing protein n=1 Tax=Clostridium felsineum TaxID=36839 RepID=A0A1S8LD70_9CLOT|nr:type II secretion system F family protein [Clostridium felsineum]URZ05894.1 hypothetical protein CLROS_012260 [Clostridium felsineum]URZ10931.1 hypothetical protein CROST_016470 [Clostridium felsineum]
MMIIALHVILFLAIIVVAYGITKNLISKRKIEKLFLYFDEKYKNRLIDKKIDEAYRKKKKNIFGKLDSLIYMSGIRKYFKYMNSELFILGVFIISFLFSIVIFELYGSWIFTVEAFLAIPIIFYGILKEMVQINFDKIDNSIMFFISSLKSNAEIKNNIVFMIGETTKKLKEPLKTYNDDFIRDVRFGISIDKAFENYINKVENVRFKNILKNLYICSLNNANYSKLLDKTRIIVRNYYEEKEKRKRKVRTAQISIMAIVAVSVVILHSLSGITSNFYALLTRTTAGQILVGYMICVVLIAIYKCITLKEFNY